MRKIVLLAVACLVFIGASPKLPPWAESVREVRLSNGMKFLLYPRGEAPIFSAFIRFRAGGIEEESGKTGLAHFLEHMAFKGTETIGTNDYEKEKPILEQIDRVGEELAAEYGKGTEDAGKIAALREQLRKLHDDEVKYLNKEALAKKMLENGGSDYNATTSKDMTTYYVSLPSDKLRFWAEMESQRIFKPVFREFYEEKDVVLEERRMRVDNDPDGRLYEVFIGRAFDKSPYHWPTIGSSKDILRLTSKDLAKFWRRYYRPSRMIGAIVGRIDPKETEKILEETFGKIRFEGKDEEGAEPEKEPVQENEKKVVLKIPARPRILIGYHKPTVPEEDDYLFDLLEGILGDGRSSRLHRALVDEKKLASHVGTTTGVPGSRLPNLFMIEVNPIGGHTADEVIRAVDEVIGRVKRDGVTARELQKAKNRLTVELLWRMKTNKGLASLLTYYETIAGDWRYLAEYLDHLQRFGPEDVRRVANDYLKPTNRTIAILEP